MGGGGRQGSGKLGPLGLPVSDKVKVGRTNHVGQERSNWTYCQYKGHLTHIKERQRLSYELRTIFPNRTLVGQIWLDKL